MKLKRTGLSESSLAYFMVTPAVLCILVIALFPVLRTLWLSLQEMQLQLVNQTHCIGLANYIQIAGDGRFWASVGNTLYFTVCSVSLELVGGFGLALIMNASFKGRGLLRAGVLVPWAIPTIISAMMWRFIYHDQFGVLNDILMRLGLIHQYHTWLGNEATALWAVIIADVWKTTPFMALLILAGLQTIPQELYESARVDGAGALIQLGKITLPLVAPTVLIALIFRTLDAVRVFDLIFGLTGGGPGNCTESLSLYAYKTLFNNLDFGYGSALAVTIFGLTFLISFLYIRLLDGQKALSQ